MRLILFVTPLCGSGVIRSALLELGKIVVYDTGDTIDLDTVAPYGGILAKTFLLGIDPNLPPFEFRDWPCRH